MGRTGYLISSSSENLPPLTVPEHARFLSHFPSLGSPSFALCRFISEVQVSCLRVVLCHLPGVVSVTEGEDGCSALAGVCVSLLLNQCLVMSHQQCRVRMFGGKKLIVVER